MGDPQNNMDNLENIKAAGVEWVRMDVKKPVSDSAYIFEYAEELELKVIAVITSRRMLDDHGYGCEHYLPGSGWGGKWKDYVRQAVEALSPYVDIWQIDNELNHPWHNTIPTLNRHLAGDIVEMGADAVKSVDPAAQTTTNLFHRVRGPLPFPGITLLRDGSFIEEYRDRLRDKIDILGMDVYRGSWHWGNPERYPDDLDRYHSLWQGDVMILETGYCTGIWGHTEEKQREHVRQVFRHLENHLEEHSWFRGLVWYEYDSKHHGLPCEEFFGLYTDRGERPKPAWDEFVSNVNNYNQSGKILGIMYHW